MTKRETAPLRDAAKQSEGVLRLVVEGSRRKQLKTSENGEPLSGSLSKVSFKAPVLHNSRVLRAFSALWHPTWTFAGEGGGSRSLGEWKPLRTPLNQFLVLISEGPNISLMRGNEVSRKGNVPPERCPPPALILLGVCFQGCLFQS